MPILYGLRSLAMETSIKELHRFSGHPGKFWPDFLEFASRQAGAYACILLARKKPDAWKQLSVWTADKQKLTLSDPFSAVLEDVAETALQQGSSWSHAPAPDRKGPDTPFLVLGLRLEEDPARPSAAVFLIPGSAETDLETTVLRLLLLADTPAIYQRQRAAQRAQMERAHFAEALDLMILLNAEKRYLAAAMILVNETAARHQCSRVSLGWLEKGYLHLQAINHMERFERKMAIVGSLEAAMEEAFDQDEEILLPPPEEHGPVVRDHEKFAMEQKVQCMLSLPMRLDGEPVAVLTCERDGNEFTEDELCGLRVLCDQAVRRLGDLKESDRWFGAKLALAARSKISGLLGVEHTLAKVVGLLVCALMVFIHLVKLPYRVEAPFILRSEDVRKVSVPFEGYIDDVRVKIGQQVQQSDLLLSLDTGDLLLEESAAIANQLRYLREAEKARARSMLVEMKIAQAQAEQASAQLDLVRYRLSQAELRSPLDGIVVEGDLEELRGAPVAKGDILFKVARNDNLFAELKVNERDIHELAPGQAGEIAFVSQPQLKFPITIDRIDPVAQADEAGNVFPVRCYPCEESTAWWRPGMSGIVKVDVGERPIVWILTHRTLDFLRMLLWW